MNSALEVAFSSHPAILHSLFQLDGELLYAPGFPQPPNLDYQGYHSYVTDNLPPESPYLYGLHPNAEIGFLTTTSESLFRTVLEMQPRDSSSGAGSVATREEKVGLRLAALPRASLGCMTVEWRAWYLK